MKGFLILCISIASLTDICCHAADRDKEIADTLERSVIYASRSPAAFTGLKRLDHEDLLGGAAILGSPDAGNPLTIYVSVNGSRVEVRNRIQPLVSSPLTTGRGLALLKARYQDLTDEPVIVSGKEDEFIVSIPLLFDSNMKA